MVTTSTVPVALAPCLSTTITACPPSATVQTVQPAVGTQKPKQVATAPAAQPLDRSHPLGSPGTGRIYDELYGLQEVQSLRGSDNDIPILIVQGLVVNMSRSPRSVPPLVAIVTDGDGKELRRWVFNAEAETLGPGATTGFRSESYDPTNGLAKVTITFAPVQRASSE